MSDREHVVSGVLHLTALNMQIQGLRMPEIDLPWIQGKIKEVMRFDRKDFY